ncbi:hypothetical protein C0Q70_02944 [Pomacea canaliculata]|uniref:Uncharacterized protein n=1 Tax=Pomacea canaliculata TaxID=400727 RepID=A0A2T7PRD3_POMCA|nr:hypothetical protein C0Q70_02944 [Pomacea canaliculata]
MSDNQEVVKAVMNGAEDTVGSGIRKPPKPGGHEPSRHGPLGRSSANSPPNLPPSLPCRRWVGEVSEHRETVDECFCLSFVRRWDCMTRGGVGVALRGVCGG